MMSIWTNGLHLISLGEKPRTEGLVASTEEQLGNNVMGRIRIDSGNSLCYFIVREANEGRMASLPKIEEAKSNELFKLKT